MREAESAALRRFLRRRTTLLSSAPARSELVRAVLPLGPAAVRRVQDVLVRIEPARANDRVLDAAGGLVAPRAGSPDAIHLATARPVGVDLGSVVTYDERMVAAANVLGLGVASPG